MSTNAQIAANQQNAKLSTGPTTEAGLKRSSQNACKHGFTGQTLVITPQEKEGYEAHVAAYMDHHKPLEHKHRELVQQLADSHWSLHQIFIQQTNTMSLMTAVTLQLSEAGDPIAAAAAIAPISRTLNTLSTYEVRRRRAAKSIQEELNELERQIADKQAQARKASQTKAQPEIGSVCSEPVEPVSTEQQIEELQAFLRDFEAKVGPEETARLRQLARERTDIL
jgi:hypothetical protein